MLYLLRCYKNNSDGVAYYNHCVLWGIISNDALGKLFQHLLICKHMLKTNENFECNDNIKID